MKIVVDANVVISALIKDSLTRKIIRESGFDFYFPNAIFEKIRKYRSYIIKKSGLSEEGFSRLIISLLGSIKLIPKEEIKKHWEKSKEIMEKIDQEDVVFIASALAIDNSVIWSEDKHFEKQKVVGIIKTKDLARFVE